MRITRFLTGLLCLASLEIALANSAYAEPRAKHWLAVGARVTFDSMEASSAAYAQFKSGTILECRPDANTYSIQSDDGKVYTIINTDYWVKAGASDPTPAATPAQGTPQAGQAPQAQTPGKPPAGPPQADFAGAGECAQCNTANGFKQFIFNNYKKPHPELRPEISFSEFKIGGPVKNFYPAIGSPAPFVPDSGAKMATPVKVHYVVNQYYDDCKFETEFEKVYYFYKDDVGECVGMETQGRMLRNQRFPYKPGR